MSPSTVLITGAAGFIGSHLAERMLADGLRVVGLDNFDPYYAPEIKRRNVAQALADPDYELVEGDIRDARAVEKLFSRVAFDGVIHLAARAGVRPSIEDPETYTSVNLMGTTVLLEAARRHGVKRFVFGSSSSVYGNNEKVPFGEDDPVDHPISPYAATKKAGEVLCHAHHHLFGMRVACLRFFTVYGPRQRPEMAIHKFSRLLAGGRPIERFGDGSSARDYTYVADIVEGIVRSWERCRTYHVWNLGGSQTITLDELTRQLAGQLGVPLRIDEQPPQAGDVDRTWADISRAADELDWRPQVPLKEGIRLFLDWFKKQAKETV
ncbi:MAG: SDR family NAD(P)-dependent oxidoreductase [bacterium]|nr:SDR family NAD(P)-dependent oxidoreductase [bacterium]